MGDTIDVGPSNTPITVDTVGANNPERRLAEAQNPAILATYGGSYSNPGLERAVAGVVGRLVAVSPDPNQTYTVTLLDSPQVNAFALPGGYLYVTRGLLALANDSSELAAVIAHEMAHVLAKHGIARREREAEVELASRVVADVLADNAEARAQVVRGRLRLAEFNRSQELEADQIGIELMARAGFDPYAAARFQQSMAAYSRYRSVSGDGDSSLDFLASHPSAPRRVTAALDRARKIGPPGSGDQGREAYLRGINNMSFGDSAAEGFVRGLSFLHPALGIRFDVPEGFKIENTAQAVLATGPGDQAVRFDGVTVPQSQSLGAYLQSGWVVGLDLATIQETTINGLPAAMARASANQWNFDVTIFRVGGSVYRILTAAPANDSGLSMTANEVRNSFRVLTDAERADLRPLTLQIVTVKSGDTPASLASQMYGVDVSLELFKTLNAISPGGALSIGQQVKIVGKQ